MIIKKGGHFWLSFDMRKNPDVFQNDDENFFWKEFVLDGERAFITSKGKTLSVTMNPSTERELLIFHTDINPIYSDKVDNVVHLFWSPDKLELSFNAELLQSLNPNDFDSPKPKFKPTGKLIELKPISELIELNTGPNGDKMISSCGLTIFLLGYDEHNVELLINPNTTYHHKNETEEKPSIEEVTIAHITEETKKIYLNLSDKNVQSIGGVEIKLMNIGKYELNNQSFLTFELFVSEQ